jgi:hypothetical protein
MEQRADMKVSTLRETIEAMGGRLELVAHFPAGAVKITRLDEAARFDPSPLTPTRLLGEILQEQGVHGAFQTHVQCARASAPG